MAHNALERVIEAMRTHWYINGRLAHLDGTESETLATLRRLIAQGMTIRSASNPDNVKRDPTASAVLRKERAR